MEGDDLEILLVHDAIEIIRLMGTGSNGDVKNRPHGSCRIRVGFW
jgi:hypothetical protein